MALVTLNAIKGGINRLRVKGSPSPNNLFDALNCYIDASGAPQSRPGTVIAYTVPAGCKGLTAANGELVTFCHEVVGPMPDGVALEVLSNPDDPTVPLFRIHYAGPFLGDSTGVYLYVAAEFMDGSVYHYWLRSAGTWQPDTIYMLGDLVTPTSPNGLTYRATRLLPADPLWTPDTAVTLGDVVEPTEFNGYKYEAIDIIGDARTGDTEPAWNTGDGAITYEDVDIDGSNDDGVGGGGSVTTPPTSVTDRYNNPGGSRPPEGGTSQVPQ